MKRLLFWCIRAFALWTGGLWRIVPDVYSVPITPQLMQWCGGHDLFRYAHAGDWLVYDNREGRDFAATFSSMGYHAMVRSIVGHEAPECGCDHFFGPPPDIDEDRRGHE